MKYIILCTGILLAGCGQKTPGDAPPQQAPDQPQQQAPADAQNSGQQPGAVIAAAPAAARAPQRTSSGDATYQHPVRNEAPEPEPEYSGERSPQQVVSVYVDPPLEEPPPVRVAWAPPPMLVEEVPPPPSNDAVWIGGYWVWQGDWVWAHGRWAQPPRRDYRWENPYYEHRGDSVVFVDGYWSAPGRSFAPPPQNAVIALAILASGIIAGERPRGPAGVFVPPPPGSHRGLMVPAPIGTPPAVVTSAPPIIRDGMHITVNNISNRSTSNVTNITNIEQVNNVTLVAPASATANGQAVHATIPTRPHLAAALSPMVKAMAPAPLTPQPIPAFVPGRAQAALPPPQHVNQVPPSPMQRRAENPAHAFDQGGARTVEAPAAQPQPNGPDFAHERGVAPMPQAHPDNMAHAEHRQDGAPLMGQPRPAEQARAPLDLPKPQQPHVAEAGRAPAPAPVPAHPMQPAPLAAMPHEHHANPAEPVEAPRAPKPAEAHPAPMAEHHEPHPPTPVAAVAKPPAPGPKQAEHEEGKPRGEGNNGHKKSEEEKKKEEAR